jgi:hypothetical protein
MSLAELGDFEFRADSVRAGDQDGVLIMAGEELAGEIKPE